MNYQTSENINNLIVGTDENDTLQGTKGNDTIIGNKGDDLKVGNQGDDRFIWNNGDGSDIMEGDTGYDITEVNGAVDAGDDFELRANGHRTEFERLNLGKFTLDVDNVEEFEINAGGGDDTLNVRDLTGTDIQQVVFNGGDGNDYLDATESNVQVIADGGAGYDTLKGSSVPDIADTLRGGDGNDTIIGNKGDDLQVGGWGDDRFIWNNGDGSDIMEGDSGYDTTEVNGAVDAGDDFELRANGHRTEFERLNLGNFTLDVDNVEKFEINGGGGNDTLNVRDLTGTDVQQVVFNGGDGNDYLNATESNVQVIADGGAGYDTLKGSSVPDIADTLKGGAGDDIIVGNKGGDLKIGGDGNDRLIWNNGDGSDIMEGDAGYDTTEVNGAVDAGDDFELRANGHRTEFERLNLGNFTLDVDNVEKFEINGGGGDDTLNVRDLTGTDIQKVVFNGGDGNDYFYAGETDVDTISRGGAGNDTLRGGAGNDVIFGGNGNDLTDGGAGNDTADFSDIGFGINANLENGTAQYLVNDVLVEDKLVSIENLNGSALDDTFTGDDRANMFQGGEGIDTLKGLDGNDTIVGDLGDDLQVGGWGDDRFIWNNGDGSDIMEGDAGYDTTEVNGAVDAGDDFELRANGDRTEFERLNLGNFTLNVDNVEEFEINGGGGDDTLNVRDLTGTDVQKVVFNGGDGNDYFNGSNTSVDITAYGDSGNDTLTGGSGNDIINGGEGNDILIGGAGADTFVLGSNGVDNIVDFNFSEGDTIQISTLEFGISAVDSLNYDTNTQTLYYGETALTTLENPVSEFNPSEYVDLV